MKKRILALALAGTTAFSVFGAAMSANAAAPDWWDNLSSHFGANDDAYYEGYKAAANMHWDTKTASARLVYNDVDNPGLDITSMDIYTIGQPKTEKVTDAGNAGTLDTIAQGTTLYVKDPSTFAGATNYYTVENVNKLPGYHATLEDFMASKRYAKAEIAEEANGDLIFKDAQGVSYTIYTNSRYTEFYAFSADDISQGFANSYTKLTKNAGGYLIGINAVATSNTDVFYSENHNGNASYTVEVASYDASGNPNPSLKAVFDGEKANSYYIAELETAGLNGYTNYFKYDKGTRSVAYVYEYTGSENGVWVDMRYDELSDVIGDYEAIMSEPVSNGVVYLYDYYYSVDYPASIDADDFADGWADKTLGDMIAAAKKAPEGTIHPELGYTERGIRGDVIYNFENFLDSIGLYDTTVDYRVAWAEQMIDNYDYLYSDDVVLKVQESGIAGVDIYWVGNADVDVYNFAELIEDIVNMAPKSAIEDAQTSELVYLMQQYYKYIDGGYVSPEPVDTDDWGDLLVSLLQAPTEDDFRNARSYDRYMDEAENLIEDYQEAYTAVEINLAEAAMYNFITGGSNNDKYGIDGNGDESTSELGAALDKTVYNLNWVKYGEAYAGACDQDGDGELTVGKALKVNANLEYVMAMYPGNDYKDASNDEKNYPGVNDAIDYSGLNDSYFWFANVYTLAYNVFDSNEYQGTIDLMTEALNEAIDNLAPTTVASPSAALRAEESSDKLADLIDTDYVTAMWANRDKVYNFITERVVNDETGKYGALNSAIMAEDVADELGNQRSQTNVTRTDIANVKTALSDAQTALTALEKDDDAYNAAQATALKNAIADCEYVIDVYNGDLKNLTVNDGADRSVGDKDQILKSDCTNAIQAVEDAINFKNIIQGWSKDEDGNWKYGVEDTYDSALTWGVEDTLEGPHYLNFGWAKIGNTWFYFDDEGIAKESDWLQVGNDWYYFNKNCGAAIGWAKVDDQWYYFNQGCKMMTGWQKVDGNWYYLKPSGAMATGWCQVDGKWYYLSTASNSLGQMYYSTTTPDGYQVGADGALVE